jgi:hypothetical protein
MNSIQLNLTLDETNTLLEALGQLPYVRVYTLINKVQQQASISLKEEARPQAERNGFGSQSLEPTGEIK